MTQSKRSFQEISTLIHEYLEERDWGNNTQRGLAISISLEASELLEHYQWRDDPVGTRDEVAEELADIFLYSFQLAQNLDIDIAEEIIKKLEKVKKKYPAEKFKGVDREEARKNWLDAKLKHKKSGL